MVFQLVASTFLKFLQKRGCPCGSLYLVRIIKEGVRVGRLCALKGLFYVAKVICHRCFVEVVNHQSFATWRSAFHLHHTVFGVKGNDAYLAVCLWEDLLQYELTVLLILLGQRQRDIFGSLWAHDGINEHHL